tara:strand:- start:7645 stop:7839 length:195 start_codon:yes stop_codon:yes gene_type:complete
MNTEETEKILLTVIELAKRLGVSSKTIYMWTRENKIPYIIISSEDAKTKHYRYILNDVIEALRK